jgi:hypothetical protein
MRFILAFLLISHAATVIASDDDVAIAIKLKEARPGDSFKWSKSQTATDKKSFAVLGFFIEEEERIVRTFVYVEELLDRLANRQRLYHVAEVTKNDEKQGFGLAGKTVVIQQLGDRFTFTVDERPLAAAALDVLDREFNHGGEWSASDFLPLTPVNRGTVWKVDSAKLTKMAPKGLGVDADKSSMSAKLSKLYDKAGSKFGVIEFDAEIALNRLEDFELKGTTG